MTKPTRERKPLWHRGWVGGMWEEMGRLQLDYLVSQGLRPEHRFLDVGCGPLRAGLQFLPYLAPGNYYGIDRKAEFLDAGRWELEQAGLADRQVHLRETDAFDVDFGVVFDFVLAQSVFTHLPLNSIRLCLARVATVLAPHGRFYATFFRAGVNELEPLERHGIVTHFHRDPFHYPADHIRWASGGTGLSMRYVGEWGHPRGQEMLLFTPTIERH